MNKPLLLHLVAYLYYWQMRFNSVFKVLISIYYSDKSEFSHTWIYIIYIWWWHTKVLLFMKWYKNSKQKKNLVLHLHNFHALK